MLQLFNLRYKYLIWKIEFLIKKFQDLTYEEILNKSFELKEKYNKKKNLNKLIPESFALTQRVIHKCFNIELHQNQILGGLILNDGKIINMKTGEGKTLTALLPACLQALTGKGVHIITSNDYLSKRDKENMEEIFSKLGFSVGLIQTNMSRKEKKINYGKDIIYITSSVIIFDYLIDNMALNKEDIILKSLYFCIIDEIDSILIDEAQNPLIISEVSKKKLNKDIKYYAASFITNSLKNESHFFFNQRNKRLDLTHLGETFIKKILMIDTLYDYKNSFISYFKDAIKVRSLFFKDIQYTIKRGNIVMIDEHTGRITSDRQWSEGIQQSLEAKENLEITKNTRIKSYITSQIFFLQYSKISGMSGTAKEVENEFKKIYNLAVIELSSDKKDLRKDLPDIIFKNKELELNSIVKKCKELSFTGQPILIGTKSVKESELVANALAKKKIKFQLLNAKINNSIIESDIISLAGKPNKITISTNMVGRGTDIILGGDLKHNSIRLIYEMLLTIKRQSLSYKKNFLLLPKLSKESMEIFQKLIFNANFLNLPENELWNLLKKEDKTFESIKMDTLIEDLTESNRKQYEEDRNIVLDSGGLFVLGIEKNISKRIDNQLKGRCARQGEPGTSQFFLNLEDDFFRIHGNKQIQKELKKKIKTYISTEFSYLNQYITKIQDTVEQQKYQSRKTNFEYDKIVHEFRSILYFKRSKILDSNNIKRLLVEYFKEYLSDLIYSLKKEQKSNKIVKSLFEKFLIEEIFFTYNRKRIIDKLFEEITQGSSSILPILISKIQVLQEKENREIVKRILLEEIDSFLSILLEGSSILKEIVVWRSLENRKPLVEYRKEMISFFYSQERIFRKNIFYNLVKILSAKKF
uniref:Protein translocase subunit SecA n=1 Tax=Nitzschia sp. PL1-4 TaxID=2083272 RepID=A0A2Z5ZA99_9STRA|nr:preprotein translocase subunit A [Nitzschia sp. PL1-4]